MLLPVTIENVRDVFLKDSVIS